MPIRDEMPILARHEGYWMGKYTLIDTEGTILDKYKSHLSCQFPKDSPYSYYQINRYQWPDGKREEHHFAGTYRDKKVLFDTERIYGCAWEADDSTLLLRFSYKMMPEINVYEMIHISPCNNYRSCTGQWFKNNRIFKHTLIQEERVR